MHKNEGKVQYVTIDIVWSNKKVENWGKKIEKMWYPTSSRLGTDRNPNGFLNHAIVPSPPRG